MADARIRVLPSSDDPGRPPKGLASGSLGTPLPPVILVQPEVIAALNRLAAAVEGVTAAIVPDGDALEAEYCGAAIWRRGDAGVPLLCTRPPGHEPGHVAHDEGGNVIVCQLGRPPAGEGFVCPACGEGAT